MNASKKSRTERRLELQQLWNTRDGRQQILQLFYFVYPDGVRLPDKVSMIDVILTHEYGSDEDKFLRSMPKEPDK